MSRSFLSVLDLSPEELREVLDRARELKAQRRSGTRTGSVLTGKSFALIFEKPSLRTRMSFEVGLRELGALSVTYLAPTDIRLGKREAVQDVARNLERWVDGVIARVFDHEVLEVMRDVTGIPIVNALSDREHPCQALADFQAIYEVAGTYQVRLAFVGDGNNVAHSLGLLAAALGASFTLVAPEGYTGDPVIWEKARDLASRTGGEIRIVHDPREGVRGAQFVYTDVWASMGQEEEADIRRQVFRPYQVNEALLANADPEARVMHCLPAHRGEEITGEVLDGPRSIVLEQAENRLHAQKALLAFLFRE